MTLKKGKEIIGYYLEKVKVSPETNPEIQEITRVFQTHILHNRIVLWEVTRQYLFNLVELFMVFSHFKWDHKADDGILIEYQKMSLIEEITVENLDPTKEQLQG